MLSIVKQTVRSLGVRRGVWAARALVGMLVLATMLPGAWGDETTEAARQLEAARARVTTAARQVQAARTRLDDFLAGHFAAIESIAPPTEADAAPRSQDSAPTDAIVTRLQGELDTLRAKRETLLRTLTESHPEVIDVDEQIATVEAQLAALSPTRVPTAELSQASGQALTEYVARLRRDSQAAASEGAQLLAEWRSAEAAWSEARQQVTALEQQLAASRPVPQAPLEQSPVAAPPVAALPAVPSAPGATQGSTLTPADDLAGDAAAGHTAGGQGPGMHMLVLAALAVALAISALAAVRLARTSADPVFASADEAAAALAIPVVGIVPRGAGAIERVARQGQHWGLLSVQLLLAVAVFLAIAYAIEHAEAIASFFRDPVPALRSLLGV